ncbi:hypothetical protein ROZALSC1DRAFT_29600 [Rozella allomycis CSF55]|uniref:Uncharacterized protein n=1 Tax=Rozella allomycis (strain CSF55) TaxID=988480 RepID=A0A4P9YI66_ROZAC|nr:hypothetical protein ROZALSC1DRAFT_29600 [Rozella allomycis CSF55]
MVTVDNYFSPVFLKKQEIVEQKLVVGKQEDQLRQQQIRILEKIINAVEMSTLEALKTCSSVLAAEKRSKYHFLKRIKDLGRKDVDAQIEENAINSIDTNLLPPFELNDQEKERFSQFFEEWQKQSAFARNFSEPSQEIAMGTVLKIVLEEDKSARILNKLNKMQEFEVIRDEISGTDQSLAGGNLKASDEDEEFGDLDFNARYTTQHDEDAFPDEIVLSDSDNDDQANKTNNSLNGRKPLEILPKHRLFYHRQALGQRN